MAVTSGQQSTRRRGRVASNNGTHPRLGGMHARIWGSVASAVVRHAVRPALVVPAVSSTRTSP
jgi:hypothetical protein